MVPPLVGVAVKVIFVPEQIAPTGFRVILTNGVTWALTVKAADALAPALPLNVGVVDPIEILYPAPVIVPAGIVIVCVRPVTGLLSAMP